MSAYNESQTIIKMIGNVRKLQKLFQALKYKVMTII